MASDIDQREKQAKVVQAHKNRLKQGKRSEKMKLFWWRACEYEFISWLKGCDFEEDELVVEKRCLLLSEGLVLIVILMKKVLGR